MERPLEIPANDWPSFFDRFSKDHLGARVDVETRATGEHQLQARDLPLEGISAEAEGTRKGAIEVIVGTEPDRLLTHIIDHPTSVKYGSADGMEEFLEIDSDSGPTVVHFKSEANPDLVKKVF
jgi:hypothetical protein